MRAAIQQAISVGPDFLRGDIDADQMAHTMVGAVRTYVDHEKAAGQAGKPHGQEAEALQQTLAELYGCGSGYLAGRCDGACVARTITYMVNEFGAPPQAS